MTDIETPDPQAVDPDGFPSHVAPGELVESAWGNAVVDNLRAFLRPSGATPVTFGANTVTSAESSLGTWSAPAAGLWLIGFTVVVSAGAAFGFLDVNLRKGGGTVLVNSLNPIRFFDGLGRQSVNGLALVDLVAAESVHLRAKTFTATVDTEGSQMVPMRLRQP